MTANIFFPSFYPAPIGAVPYPVERPSALFLLAFWGLRQRTDAARKQASGRQFGAI
jgi:hypothetical protein